MKLHKTYTPKPAEVERAWWVVDASGLPLGRLASEIAQILRGKHKPTYAPHVDMGDHVVVVNASEVKVSSGKSETKIYYRHSGFSRWHQSREFRASHRTPPRVDRRASRRGMLPKNKLGRKMISKLKVYPGPDHPHQAQSPQSMTFDIRKVEA